MDGVDEEVTAIDAEISRLQSKESEHSLKAESCNVLETQETVRPADACYPSSSHEVFGNILDGQNLSRDTSSFSESDYCSSVGGGGIVVEELTVTNYNGVGIASLGSSNNREKVQSLGNQWPVLRQLGAGSGRPSSVGDDMCRGSDQANLGKCEDVGHTRLAQNMSYHGNAVTAKQLDYSVNGNVSSDKFSSEGIRTKVLSKNWSEFFFKSKLSSKGVMRRSPFHDGYSTRLANQTDTKPVGVTIVASSGSQGSSAIAALPSLVCTTRFSDGPNSSTNGVSLREWLKSGRNSTVDSLVMFRQIVDQVDSSHSKGVALQDLRPSFFKLLPSNQVIYAGNWIQLEGPESVRGKRLPEQGMFSGDLSRKKQKFSARWQLPLSSEPDCKLNTAGPLDGTSASQDYNFWNTSSGPHTPCRAQMQLGSACDHMEEKWYTSPEELSAMSRTSSSNVYQLGVLLFELLNFFNSEQDHVAAMSDLHHRILPPRFLSECPREAAFCLWLLHPEPSSRPTTREILQSEVIDGVQEVCRDELSSIEQDDLESDLLSHFLLLLKEQKQKRATKLVEDLKCIEGDIEEIKKRRLSETPLPCSHTDYHNGQQSMFLHNRPSSPEALSVFSSISSGNDVRLQKNMSQLESAYFSMRSTVQLPEADHKVQLDDLLKHQEHTNKIEKPVDPLGVFFDGLCKYARYSGFEVRSVLRNGDFISSANVICSLSFDRDEDYFAAAGISKKIKIFDFHALLNDSVDVHYPAVEMVNRSKLSCVCWNNYIKNYLASADYDGVVKLWDAGTGQAFSHYIEHQKRAWSVDFSRVDPTRLASGSDDHTVKLWSINENNCFGTIRNKANVCCVQFSPNLSHLLAFGSADYKTYCYDLRNSKIPWCVLAGHEKAVSYVKFLDSTTVVSASTDNTLKLWDLNKTSSSGFSINACYLTLRGHTNEKNFVGLSVDDGYIACGSETNEVYAYYKSMPMPITSYKFGSIDPVSGKETDEDGGQFVSSVCWRRKTDMVIAANSAGCIKVLQMV